tara:strand:+ start:702 stop:1124 length:423 start_codon:yes stop_codon:yes gene_type:complete
MSYGEVLVLFFIELRSLYKKKIDLKGASFQQVIAIASMPLGGIEMSALSEKLGIDNSTATRLINGLVAKNWVSRYQDEDDKRIIKVKLTEKGKVFQVVFEKQFDKIGHIIEKNINPIDKQKTIEAISKLKWIILKMNNIK